VGNSSDALSIFKLNVEAFPGSSNAYDSYAEAIMLFRNKPKAIENYQKSIELNPRNKKDVRFPRG